MSAQTWTVEFQGHDRIDLTQSESGQFAIKAKGCLSLLKLTENLKIHFAKPLKEWPIPQGTGHAPMLVRELLLKARGEWEFPYPHEELCHCRTVKTSIVDSAILAGAHKPEAVTRLTSASSACGTCRPDVQKILAYRLSKV